MILFKGGRLIDPASKTDAAADVLVEDGVITAVGKDASGKAGATQVNIDGAVICPGFVDLHVHLREPGREDEETISSGSQAAAVGGFTAICAMPNTDPVCDHPSVARLVMERAGEEGFVDVHPAAAITQGLEGKTLSPIGELVDAGVRMFTDDGRGVQNSAVLRRAMEYIKGFDALCAEHCEDASLTDGGQMNEGAVSDLLGLKGMPSAAEDVALARDLSLVALTGVRFHALHTSTIGSADLIRRAKQQGLRVTAEVTPHHLSLDDSNLKSFDPVYKVNPPLRSQQDVSALLEAVAQGVIDAIATDHAPHSLEEKEGEFEVAPPGMLGLETALGVVNLALVEEGVIDVPALVKLLSFNPAQILRLEEHGGPIAPGRPANLTVFDPAGEWTVDPASFSSLSRNSPWAGNTLIGKVLHTMLHGRLVVSDGRVLEGSHG